MADAQPYEPRYTTEGNWKRLVVCEEEWLARPAIWAFSLLDEKVRHRKEWHYWKPMLLWDCKQLGCVCAQRVAAFWEQGNEEWMDEAAVRFSNYPSYQQLTDAYKIGRSSCLRADGCWALGFLRWWRQFRRGIITIQEWKNRMVELTIWPSIDLSERRINKERFDVLSFEQKSLSEALLRDIVGNPYKPIVADSAWLNERVHALANAAHEERLPNDTLDPVRLVILADALEEAGCIQTVMLDHLRSPGPHFCGCFALDSLRPLLCSSRAEKPHG